MNSVGELLEYSARKFQKESFALYHDKVLTFENLNRKANQVANWLIDSGFSKGKKAIIYMDTHFEWIYAWFGLIKAGVIAIPVNTAYKGTMLQYLINDSEADLIFIDKKYLSRLEEVEHSIQKMRIILNKDNNKKTNTEMTAFSKVLEANDTVPNVKSYLSDTLAMLYTSGTTGPSKGVMQPHGQYLWCGEQVARQLNLRKEDIYYCWLPLFHIVPVGMFFMSSLKTGTTIALTERFSVSKFWDEVEFYNATITGGFATMIELLYKAPTRAADSENSLRKIIVGGIPTSISRDFEERFNLVLTDDYGMTEFEPISYLSEKDRLKKPGSCGRPLPDVEVKIFDEFDQELKFGKIGEIVVRPKKPFIMMKGYFNKHEDTVESWRNLWFHTGDYGYLDEDGYLYFVDRKTDSIRRRGENISSFELESIINAHPSVLESAAVGIPSELGEEDVKVVVQLKENHTLSPEDLIDYCENELAFFMVPRYIEFVDSFPRTETDKILKRNLRELNENTWDNEMKRMVK